MSEGDWKTFESLLERMSLSEKRELIERVTRSLGDGSPSSTDDERQASLSRLRTKLKSLPVSNPSDGWSAREHDELLYGSGS